MAPATAAIADRIHIGQPPTTTIATVPRVPTATPKAPTPRRPRRSASRPPMTSPIPPGVFVTIVNSVIRRAEKPCSSRRNSFSSCAAGAVKVARRNADAASSQNLDPWPAIPTSAWVVT
jgi:hypothetical protein